MHQEEQSRPTMTHREASWHATVAAIRARRMAEGMSATPEAREALALAAAQERVAEPMPHHPHRPAITIGTLWAIEISGEHDAELVNNIAGADQALWCLTLTQPERVLLSLLAKDLDEIRTGMIECASLPVETYFALDRWYGSQMQAIKTLAGGGIAANEPGKSSEIPSPSHAAAETPQVGP